MTTSASSTDPSGKSTCGPRSGLAANSSTCTPRSSAPSFTTLTSRVGVGMRLWRDRPPGPPVPEVARDYETVGYVISGRAELHSEGQMVLLEPGNAWVVPRHARHTYKILEPFTAVLVIHPASVV